MRVEKIIQVVLFFHKIFFQKKTRVRIGAGTRRSFRAAPGVRAHGNWGHWRDYFSIYSLFLS